MSVLARVRASWRDPNPIVRKELLTLLRTPVYVRFVFVALICMGLVVTGAAVAADEGSTADTTGTGRVLFQIFFSLTTLFAVIMGSTLAAVSVTLERENRTLDALRLSALGPRRIVIGKLVAVFLATAFVPAALLPMLGVVFLFGGVSVAHIAVAGAYSLALGALGIAAGTAVSARAQTTRRALIATVPAAAIGTFMLGGALSGVGEIVRRSASSAFSGPFFFADAYLALPFDARYAVGLLVTPLYVLGAGFWLAYAVAYGGLMDATEDRALPIKRWALFALTTGLGCTVAITGAFKFTAGQRDIAAIFAQALVTLTGIALAGAFAGESLVPSARVRAQRRGAFANAVLPPGLNPAVAFACVATLVGAVLAPYAAHLGAGMPSSLSLLTGAWCGSYVAALATGAAALAARTGRPAAGRAALLLALLATWVLVWLASMLMGSTPSAEEPGLLVTFSPLWVASAAVRVADVMSHGVLPAADRADLVRRMVLSGGVYAAAAAGLGWVLVSARRKAAAARG